MLNASDEILSRQLSTPPGDGRNISGMMMPAQRLAVAAPPLKPSKRWLITKYVPLLAERGRRSCLLPRLSLVMRF